MIKSILTQIWNMRRSNGWLFAELFIVFILLWLCIDILFSTFVAGSRPKGYDISHLYDIEINYKGASVDINENNIDSLAAEGRKITEEMLRRVREFNGVEGASLTIGTDTYSGDGGMFQGYTLDSIKVSTSYIRYIDPEYLRTLRVPILEGKIDKATWSESSSPHPAIITKDFADSLFHSNKDLLGRVFMDYYDSGTRYKVVAVCARQKFDDYGEYQPFIMTPIKKIVYAFRMDVSIVLRVRPDADTNFEERFLKEMSPKLNIGDYYLFNIQSYKEKKLYTDIASGVKRAVDSSQLMLSFFVFNVFLGLMGTFWFRIRQRRGDIALRMALGSSRSQVRNQLFTEGLLLLLIAAIPAIFVNLNIYLAGGVFSTKMEESAIRFIVCQLLTFGLMAAMIILGIWFPARQAMKLEPAEALHEE